MQDLKKNLSRQQYLSLNRLIVQVIVVMLQDMQVWGTYTDLVDDHRAYKPCEAFSYEFTWVMDTKPSDQQAKTPLCLFRDVLGASWKVVEILKWHKKSFKTSFVGPDERETS